MADNTTLSVGTGGDLIRDVDRSGTKTQVVGLDLGIGDGTEKLMSAGQQVMASSLPVVIASNQSAVPVSQSGGWSVSVSGTVAVSDAAQLPAALGQTTMANSLPVAIASNQSAIPVSQSGS